jgi:chemotaxis protein methyltransferase CheR
VRAVLAPRGFLLLGATESTFGIEDAWEHVAIGRGYLYRSNTRSAA